MQHSIFEPLFSLQAAHTMEGCHAAFTSQASLFSISPPSPPPSPSMHAINRENSAFSFHQEISCSLLAHIIPPSSISSHYNKSRNEHDFDLTHVEPPLSHSTLSATTPPPPSITNPPTHSKLPLSHSTTFFTQPANCDDGRKLCDDGSVASKLLSSIMTKSISSPSLHLTSSKEAVRESPYQKTLKLKQMKLQHCAEALGMESSDNSSFLYDSQCIHQEKIEMIGNPSRYPPSFTLPNSYQESSLKSVKSSPNLGSAPALITNHSKYTRSTSFPPPLSHTLPTSSSYDSLSPSLRAYREDGRFILKETMVPSKHYFHANRRNGRLTLHVFTRKEEEDENFPSQDDHEELSYKESQIKNLLEEEEEEEILECMVGLCEGFDNNEYSTNTIQSLNEEVCVKEVLGKDTSKEINIAASQLNKSLQRVNSIANHHNNIGNEDDDKRNVISNVITLSLQTSKVTLHKTQVLSFPHLSSYPLVSGSLKKSALIHSSERGHGFLSSNPQSKENFLWESRNLRPLAVASGSAHRQRKGGSGGGGREAVQPAFVMEDMRAKSVMKVVSELATSLNLEASYARGNWCLAGKKKPLLSGGECSGESSTKIGGNYGASAMGSATMNDKISGDEGPISEYGANFGYKASEEDNSSEGGIIRELNSTPSPPLSLDLQFPSCNANLQSELELEWLHTLHCKEVFDRHHLGQCFMKLHCIPTRS